MGVPINYWAVLVSTIVMLVIGWVWYGPLFGKTWAMLSGGSLDEMNKPRASRIILMILSSLIMAYTLAHAIVFGVAYTHIGGAWGGAMGAFWYWLGFIAPVTLSPVLWEKKSWKLWFINGGFYLVSLCIMGIILAVWM